MSESEAKDAEEQSQTEPSIDDEWIEETFEERVEEHSDLTLDDIREWYRSEIEDHGSDKVARLTVQSNYNEFVNVGADGEVRMVTIGGDEDPSNNGQVFVGYAVCIPEDSPARLGTVLFDRDDVDPDPFKDLFYEPYNAVKGEFDIRDAQDPVGSNAYHLNAVQGTEVERFEPDKLDTHEERKNLVHDFVPSAKIAEIGEALSLTNENGFPAGFGVDMRRIEDAFVHEVRVGKAARLVVQDDSFVEARDLGSDIRGEDGDAGLVGFSDPDLIDFGSGSIVDLYGPVYPSNDGQITMSVVGVDPHRKTEREDSGGSGDSSGSSAREDSASRSSSVAGAEEQRTI